MRKTIHRLRVNHLPQEFRRFFVPEDVILFSRERADLPPLTNETPSSSADSDASPADDDANTSSGPQIRCFYCLLDKFLCYAILVISSFAVIFLADRLDTKHIDLLTWSSFSSLSALRSTISSTPPTTLLTPLALLVSFSLLLTSLLLLETHRFDSNPAWQQARSTIHTTHLTTRLLELIPFLPHRHQLQTFLTIWLKNLETLQEMYLNLYGANRHTNINCYIRQDPTQPFHPMEDFHPLLSQRDSPWIVVRLSPYPLSRCQRFLLCLIFIPAWRAWLRNLHQTYHYWQRANAADGAFAVLDREFVGDEPADYRPSPLEGLFRQGDVDKRPLESSRSYLNETARGYGFFPRPTRSWEGSVFARTTDFYSLT